MMPHKTIFALLTAFTCLVAHPTLAKPREVWERYTVCLVAPSLSAQELMPVMAGARAAANELENEFFLEITLTQASTNSPHILAETGVPAAAHEADGILFYQLPAMARAHQTFHGEQLPGVYIGPASGLTASGIPEITPDYHTEAARVLEALLGRFNRWDTEITILRAGGVPDSRCCIGPLRQLLAAHPTDFSITEHALDADPDQARAQLRNIIATDRDEQIDALVFLQDSPLRAYEPLPWEPGRYEVVAVSGLLATLPYLARNEVQALIAPDYEDWGRQALQQIIAQLHAPAADKIAAPEPSGSRILTQNDLEAHMEQWRQWFQ